MIFLLGSDPHRRNESDLPRGRHANPSRQSVQRQQSSGQFAERLPQPECQRSDCGAARRHRIRSGRDLHGTLEQCLLEVADQAVAGLNDAFFFAETERKDDGNNALASD